MVYKSRESKPTDAPVFSHSQLSVANDCMKRWEYQYRYKKVLPATEWLRLGSANHAFLERLYNMVIRPKSEGGMDGISSPLSSSQRDELFDTAWLDDAEIELIDSYKARTYIAYYIQEYHKFDKFLIILSAENQLFVPYVTPKGRKIYFEIIIDLVALDKRNHQMVLIDHKTGGKAWSYEQAQFDIQLPIYLQAQAILGRPVGHFIINFVRTNMKDPAKAFAEGSMFTRIEVTKTQAELEGTRFQLGRRIDRMLEDVENDEIIFSLGRHCANCNYREVCRLHLAQRPKEAQLLLNTKFVDKEKPKDTKPFVLNIKKQKEEILVQEVKRILEESPPVELSSEPKPINLADWDF